MFFAFCQYPLFLNNGKKSCEAYIFIGSITKELADKAKPTRSDGKGTKAGCTPIEVQLRKYELAVVHILTRVNVDTQRAFVDTLLIALFFIAEDDRITHSNIQNLVGGEIFIFVIRYGQCMDIIIWHTQPVTVWAFGADVLKNTATFQFWLALLEASLHGSIWITEESKRVFQMVSALTHVANYRKTVISCP